MRFDVQGTEGSSWLRIYTITGKLVRRIAVGSDVHEVSWDLLNTEGRDIRPGIYIYTLADTGGNRKVGKIVIGR